MKKITLHLHGRSYSIVIGKNLLSSIGNLLKPLGLGSKILIVSNKRVAAYFLRPVQNSLRRAGFEVSIHLLPYGDEKDKSESQLIRLWKAMAEAGLERSSTILALGGGVVGDVAAFAASTYMRGISVVQVPTTLLAQVDAAIGGKTAIDLPLAKNIVGTFYHPRLVICDVSTLGSLQKLAKLTNFRQQEIQNGLAEVVKYGMIRDASLFKLLEKRIEKILSSIRKKSSLNNSELSFFGIVVWRSARVKVKVVEEDERETKGKRVILNYGHTFAHAFEAAKKYRLPHGEAVALGMVCAARLAQKQGFLSKKDELRQNELIRKIGLPTRLEKYGFHPKQVIHHMLLDKKKKGGKLRFILPEAVGRVRVASDISLSEVNQILKELGRK
ncbi:MAG: 3-dehydroquinate synthase [Candidatus Omnitrophica bacterium]|nr:3-dehydroquinate synthase [Candidatus Omnitrophota bacterium]